MGIEQRCTGIRRCIVHDDVEPTVTSHGSGDQRVDIVPAADVDGFEGRCAAATRDELRRRLAAFDRLGGEVGNDDDGAFGREIDGDRAANSRARARDHRSSSGE
jgi:hypothetical protein